MTYNSFFSCFNIFLAQKTGNYTLEASLGIPGAVTETENDFRFKPIVQSEIDFLLKFDWYSSD